VWIIRG